MKSHIVQCGALLFGARLLIGSLAGAANRQKAQPAPRSLPGSRAEIYKKIGDVELPIHIFEPPNHGPEDRRPAIVFFLGGGWRSGSPVQFQHQCEYLASRGMVAMTAEYPIE